MKKRVLFLSPLPPPHYGCAISSEMCLDILKKSNGFDVRNIKLNYSKKMKDVGKVNFDKLAGIFKVKAEIKKQLLDFRPDIVYFVPATTSFGLWRDWIFVKQIQKYWNGQILFHVRSRILKSDWESILKRGVISSVLRNQKAIALGDELVGDLHGLIPRKDIFVLPNAIKNEIEEKKFSVLMESRKKRSSFNILFLSNMDQSKGWPKLLEACKILKHERVKFRCNFVGGWRSQNDQSYFKKFVEENKLEKNVFYLGKKTERDKLNILQKSDVLVFPTEYPLETFGRVIVEGMMMGLPVIANGIATIPSIVEDGKIGFVLKENSPEEIADCIKKLQDKELRLKMGKKGRGVFLKKFEVGDYGNKFKRIISGKI